MDVLFVELNGSGQMRIGIATLAAILKKNGFSVAIADVFANATDPPYMRSKKYLFDQLKKNPRVVAFTATTPSFYYTLSAIKEARKYCDKIIIGGPHATIFREKIIEKVPDIDVVAIGEAEEIITDLIDALINEKNLSNIRGIAYRDSNGRARMTPPAPLISDLDSLPFPARELLDIDSYHAPFNVMTSRGCPYNCVYCSKPVTNTNWRSRSPENVADELEQAFERYPHAAKKVKRVVGISDDNFTIQKDRAIGICDEIINRDLNINMTCATGIHVNTVSRELLEKMRDAGCSELWFGMETGNAELLAAIGKATTIEKIKHAVKLSKEVGIPAVGGHFIIGLPNETLEKARETVAFMKNLNLDIAGVNQAVPFPSTRLWEYVKAHGKLLVDYEDVVDYRSFMSYGKDKPVFETPEFPARDREIAYMEAVDVIDGMMKKSITSPKNMLHFLTTVRSPNDLIWGVKRFVEVKTKKDLRRLAPRIKK